MGKSFQNLMMKINLRLGGKTIRGTLRLLIGASLRRGLSRHINIGPNQTICDLLISRLTFRQLQLILSKLIIFHRSISMMLLLMSTRSLTGSEKTPNSLIRKMIKNLTRRYIPGLSWRRCSDAREAID
jgi:hypothetical protein